jgi:hypothetical protein
MANKAQAATGRGGGCRPRMLMPTLRGATRYEPVRTAYCTDGAGAGLAPFLRYLGSMFRINMSIL